MESRAIPWRQFPDQPVLLDDLPAVGEGGRVGDGRTGGDRVKRVADD